MKFGIDETLAGLKRGAEKFGGAPAMKAVKRMAQRVNSSLNGFAPKESEPYGAGMGGAEQAQESRDNAAEPAKDRNGKHGYIGYCKGKQYEVYADSSYGAVKKLAAQIGKKESDISVDLAEKDVNPETGKGTQVTTFLDNAGPVKVTIRGDEYEVAVVDPTHVTMKLVGGSGTPWALHVAQLDAETVRALQAAGIMDERKYVKENAGGRLKYKCAECGYKLKDSDDDDILEDGGVCPQCGAKNSMDFDNAMNNADSAALGYDSAQKTTTDDGKELLSRCPACGLDNEGEWSGKCQGCGVKNKLDIGASLGNADAKAGDMTRAYSAGLEDAKAGKPEDLSRANGFDAAYRQGYSHGKAQAEKRNADHGGKWSQAFDVFLDGEKIDTVFFTSNHTPEEVKQSLVRHDGHPEQIVVKKGAEKRNAMIKWSCPKCGAEAEASDLYDEKICMKGGCGAKMEKGGKPAPKQNALQNAPGSVYWDSMGVEDRSVWLGLAGIGDLAKGLAHLTWSQLPARERSMVADAAVEHRDNRIFQNSVKNAGDGAPIKFTCNKCGHAFQTGVTYEDFDPEKYPSCPKCGGEDILDNSRRNAVSDPRFETCPVCQKKLDSLTGDNESRLRHHLQYEHDLSTGLAEQEINKIKRRDNATGDCPDCRDALRDPKSVSDAYGDVRREVRERGHGGQRHLEVLVEGRWEPYCASYQNSLDNAGHLGAEPWDLASLGERRGWLEAASCDVELACSRWADLSLDVHAALQDAWDVPASRNNKYGIQGLAAAEAGAGHDKGELAAPLLNASDWSYQVKAAMAEVDRCRQVLAAAATPDAKKQAEAYLVAALKTLSAAQKKEMEELGIESKPLRENAFKPGCACGHAYDDHHPGEGGTFPCGLCKCESYHKRPGEALDLGLSNSSKGFSFVDPSGAVERVEARSSVEAWTLLSARMNASEEEMRAEGVELESAKSYPDLRVDGGRLVHVPCEEYLSVGGASRYECHECGKTWPRAELDKAAQAGVFNSGAEPLENDGLPFEARNSGTARGAQKYGSLANISIDDEIKQLRAGIQQTLGISNYKDLYEDTDGKMHIEMSDGTEKEFSKADINRAFKAGGGKGTFC